MPKFPNESLDDDDPLFEACKTGDADLVRSYLERGGSVFAESPNRPHLASMALQSGNVAIVQAMLAADLDVNDALNRFHERPLSYAVRHAHLPLIRFLLAQGADVNEVNANGTSVFAGACAGSPLEIVQLLFEAGGNIRKRNSTGRTPFQWAASTGNINDMRFLLGAGALIDEADDSGTTALIGAGKGGKLEACAWLLDQGADIRAAGARGRSAEDWSRANGHNEIVKLFRSTLQCGNERFN